MDNNDNKIFAPAEIPYDELRPLGLEQAMIDDLPADAYNAMLKGLPTPLLSFKSEKSSGRVKDWSGRFYLVRDGQTGGVHAVVMPKVSAVRFGELSKTLLDEGQRSEVLAGETVRASSPDGDVLFQLDALTNQIVTADAEAVDFNIKALFDGDGIVARSASDGDLERISEGQTCTFSDGKGTMTVGIALLSPAGLLAVPGPLSQWEGRRELGEKERFTFGNFGCWVRNADDSISYVFENNYTEEMDKIWKERLRQGSQRDSQQRPQQNLS